MRPITLLLNFRVCIGLVHLSFLLLVVTQARAASVLQDIQTLAQRRASIIVSGATNAASITSWYVIVLVSSSVLPYIFQYQVVNSRYRRQMA